MPSVHRVLVVGGGISGMSLAMCLQRAGVSVEIAEINSAWGTYGAGISITAPALRSFERLGLLDQIKRDGFCSDGTTVCDYKGNVLFAAPTARVLGADIPNGGGIMRPALHAIMSDATIASGANVRLGVSVAELRQAPDGVEVLFTDGSRDTFDLVVGSDGINSRIRTIIFPEAPAPKFTGQGCWRAVAPRPPEIVGSHVFLGGPVKVGINPVSTTEMYMFVLQHVPDNPRMRDTDLHRSLAVLLEGFGGAIGVVRNQLGPASRIVYRPLEKLLIAPPWHVGRVVLIGDAVHATTPHLAAGAGIGIEDAIVLVEFLEQDLPVEEALQRFTARRFERCQMVVENSALLGELEMKAAPIEEQAAVSRKSAAALALPI